MDGCCAGGWLGTREFIEDCCDVGCEGAPCEKDGTGACADAGVDCCCCGSEGVCEVTGGTGGWDGG